MKLNSKLTYIICLIVFSIVLTCALLINHFGCHTIYLNDSDQLIADKIENAIISGKININSASIDELTMLPGIGDTLAQRIIDYRNTHGAFHRKEDLLNIKGIGNTKLDSISNYITIGGIS